MNDRHLTPLELAEREQVTIQTVYVWNTNRTGPKFMKIGRHVRYRVADVIAWEQSRVVTADGRAS
jgi:predicted DNA-binding transcriptional regulator AlpA